MLIVNRLVQLVSQKYTLTRSMRKSDSTKNVELAAHESLFFQTSDVYSELLTWSMTVDAIVALVHLFYLNTESFIHDVQRAIVRCFKFFYIEFLYKKIFIENHR